MNRIEKFWQGSLCALVLLGVAPSFVRSAEPSFEVDVAPLLKEYCIRCHGEQKPKGELSLIAINPNVATGPDINRWKSIVERMALNEMPPEGEKRPDPKSLARALAWMKKGLADGGEETDMADMRLALPGYGNRVPHEPLFDGSITTPPASPSRFWRMSPQVYAGFIPRIANQKLGEKGTKVSQPFTESSAEGFKDFAAIFAIDEPTVSQLMRNAQQIVELQSSTRAGFGRQVKEFMPLMDAERAPTEAQVAAAIARQFELAIWRKPTADEIARFQKLHTTSVRDAGPVIGARAMLATILMLPEAMYRFEVGAGPVDQYGRHMLAPRELAVAVALALTDAPPDDPLMKAVEEGRLKTAADVRREVARLLNDKKTDKPRIMRFFEEYFEFPLAEEVFKDTKDLFGPKWRPNILVDDTRALIQYVLDRDNDVLKELLTTNKAFVNYRLDPAKGPTKVNTNNKPNTSPQKRLHEWHELYNLPADWQWTPNQPIELPADQRAGILTQPSWLMAFATNDDTHPIKRGKWVRERLLGSGIPDVPITVDAQLPNAPDQTVRQRMDVTKVEYCWQCHRKMNPLGLTFENYDYIGRFRSTVRLVDSKAPPKPGKRPTDPVTLTYHNVPLDATGLIEMSGDPAIDGDVKNAVQMVKKLAESPRARQVFVRHAFRFWMGRNETLADAPTLLAADKAYVANGGSMKALITSLLTSDSFLYRSEPRKVAAKR
jgi:hypothetical protein